VAFTISASLLAFVHGAAVVEVADLRLDRFGDDRQHRERDADLGIADALADRIQDEADHHEQQEPLQRAEHARAQFLDVIAKRHPRVFEDVVRILVVEILLGSLARGHDTNPADGELPNPEAEMPDRLAGMAIWKVNTIL
jgi:hypothetical protein